MSRIVTWLEPRNEDTVRPIAKLVKIEPSVTFKIIFASPFVTAEFSLNFGGVPPMQIRAASAVWLPAYTQYKTSELP